MITFTSKGDYSRTTKSLKKMSKLDIQGILRSYGDQGVIALANATPIDSGETSRSWSYEIETTRRGASITWTNSHVNHGARIAILIQYGHGTGTGGYVAGRDYINPAMRSVFDTIADAVWKEVQNA